ncbi:MAG: hypothetical protein ABIF08_00740 [Nanoarchaeota archaeon]
MVRKTTKKRTVKKRVVKKATKKKPVRKKPVRKNIKSRVIKRKPVKRKAVKKKPAVKKTEKTLIGAVTHFFSGLSVAVIELNSSLKIGDKIIVEGATTSFQQKVSSMQIERKDIKEAKKGDDIGMKVIDRVRPGDKVYRVA